MPSSDHGGTPQGDGWLKPLGELLMAGPPPGVPLAEARAFAEQRVVQLGRLNGLSPARVFPLWERFERFAYETAGVVTVDDVTPEVVRQFIGARTRSGKPPAIATRHFRRFVVALLFKVLRDVGFTMSAPTLDLELAPRVDREKRPLTDEEVDAGRWASLGTYATTRLPAVWALSESGVWLREIAHITAGDIDFDQRRVWAHGGAKTSPRWVPLTDWAVNQLRRRVDDVRGGRLAYTGPDPGVSGRSSTTQSMREIFQRAGFDDPLIRSSSVVAWAARKRYDESGCLEHAAQLLGMRSLDRVARLIDVDWRGEGCP